MDHCNFRSSYYQDVGPLRLGNMRVNVKSGLKEEPKARMEFALALKLPV